MLEQYKKWRTKNQFSLIKKAWCESKASTESTAKAEGFDLNLLYESLSLDIAQTSSMAKAVAWRTDSCGNFLSSDKKQEAEAEERAVYNLEVVKSALKTNEICIQSRTPGLHCRLEQLSPRTALVYVNYIVLRQDEKSPLIESAAVTNGTPAIAFKPNTPVTTTGITRVLTRTEAREDMSVDIGVKGVGSCPALVMRAAPKYVVTISGKMVGERVTTKDFKQSARAPHTKCDASSTADVDICPIDGFALNGGTFKAKILNRNPYAKDHWNHCYNLNSPGIKPLEGAKAGCFNASFYTSECHDVVPAGGSPPLFMTGPMCIWSVKNGTTAEFTIQGTKTESVSAKNASVVFSNILSELPRLQFPAFDPNLGEIGNQRIEWEAIIMDTDQNLEVARLCARR